MGRAVRRQARQRALPLRRDAEAVIHDGRGRRGGARLDAGSEIRRSGPARRASDRLLRIGGTTAVKDAGGQWDRAAKVWWLPLYRAVQYDLDDRITLWSRESGYPDL